jgi:hypothetical protein
MNSVTPHPDPEMLLRHVDEDLSPAEMLTVREHLENCGDCRSRLHAMREALDDYRRFHLDILKPSLPPPPAAWEQLKFPKKASPIRSAPVRWLAAAAAIAAIFLVVRRFERAPDVRAAELLRKATVAETAAPLARLRIRIRSRARTIERTARLTASSSATETPDAAALHAIFDAAHYNWDDPLSAAAFSRWRDTLPAKQDRVDQSAGVLLVRTTSPEGALSDAALTLRASDLHAVACTLRLRSTGETIDMTELPPEALLSPAPQRPQLPAPVAPARIAGVSDELHVIAALHGIGADLGEPIDVQRAGASVLVRISGLDENRRNQIRTALAGLAGAQLQFEDVRGPGSRTPSPAPGTAAPAGTANPLIAELRARLGNGVSTSDLTDELIDATDRASERAFALRALARRFPPESASQLAPADGKVLSGILRDHVNGLATAIQGIRRLVAPILPDSQPPAAALNGAAWQALTESLPPAVERLDRTLNGATHASVERKTLLAESIADIDRRIVDLKSVSQP